MPYYTGTANSAADLAQAIINAGTANGWSIDSGILYKGDVHTKIITLGNKVAAMCGTGHSGVTLSNDSGIYSAVTDVITGYGNTPLSYPLTYHVFVHSSPDDIVCAVNFQSVWWQWLAFGKARNLGVNGKTVWQYGTMNEMNPKSSSSNRMFIKADGSNPTGYFCTTGAPFWNGWWEGHWHCAIHVDLDGIQWAFNDVAMASPPLVATVIPSVPEIIKMTPNAWNGDAVLAPIIVACKRPSNFLSHVAELTHMRYTRNDYFNDGQIITIGSERWFCAPVYRKNTVYRSDSSGQGNHSGTVALAIRYDGP